MSELVIVRAPSGFGKSTYVKKNFIPLGYVHLEADQFFIENNEYKFNRSKLGAAHTWCQLMTEKELRAGKNVVVSNTSTTLRELNTYIKIANDCGVPYRVIRLTNQFENVHGVPSQVIENMKSRFEDYPGETILTTY